jgi:hypothetical protein
MTHRKWIVHDWQQMYAIGDTGENALLSFQLNLRKRGINMSQLEDWLDTQEINVSPTESKTVVDRFKKGRIYDFKFEEGKIKS